MKANFKIETEYLKKALEIFEPDEKGDRAGRVRRVRKVCFFPYGKWTLLASMTDHVAYFAIIKNRIPQPFSLVPESELNAIINKHAKLNFIVDFGGLGSISYIHPDQWKEYELDCVQISTINFDAEKKFVETYFNEKYFLSVLNGRSSKRLSQYENIHRDDWHTKPYINKWMVGGHFKVYECKNMNATIWRTKNNLELYVVMDWITTDEEAEPPSLFRNFMDLLNQSQIMTAEEVRTVLMVDNVHGIYQPKVFAEKYPHICLQNIDQDELDILLEFGKADVEVEDSGYWEIWDKIYQSLFEWEGETWGILSGPSDDIFAYNQADYDSLSVEEQEKCFM